MNETTDMGRIKLVALGVLFLIPGWLVSWRIGVALDNTAVGTLVSFVWGMVGGTAAVRVAVARRWVNRRKLRN